MRILVGFLAAAFFAQPAFGASKTVGYNGYTNVYENTKSSASSKTEYVTHRDVVSVASNISSDGINGQKSNKNWNASSLPTGGIWPLGFTFKDYVDFIWNYSINTLGEKETEMYKNVNEVIYGPEATLTPEQQSKGINFNGSGYDENSPIEIGKYAKSALNTNDIANVTTPGTSIRNVGIAIGAHALAEGSNNLKNQNISIGFAAHTKGSSMIAIGPGSKDSTETDWNGNNTYAEGSATTAIGYSVKAFGTQAVAIGGGDSGKDKPATIASNNYTVAVGAAAQATAPKAVAMGRNARSTAEGAVQLGEGINTTPNSLKFRDVTIVEDGRLMGGAADPKDLDISVDDVVSSGGEIEVSITPGSVVTILPATNLYPGAELHVAEPTKGLRNYEVYFPNEPEMCTGLPIGQSLDMIKSNHPEIRVAYMNGKWAHRLPAKFKVTQPYARLVIGEITEIDDGTDWSPVITACNLKFNSDVTKLVTDGRNALEGTKLNSGVSLKIAYPISGGKVSTNDLATVGSDGIISGTFYEYVTAQEFTPTGIVPTSGDITWIEIIYETKCGTTPAVFRKELDMAE
jgi:hypothetical protein